jgi:hypothetical protein
MLCTTERKKLPLTLSLSDKQRGHESGKGRLGGGGVLILQVVRWPIQRPEGLTVI